MAKYRSKSMICKRSNKTGGWNIPDKIREEHLKLNSQIRKARKPIVKPDLDKLMDDILNNPVI